jgi:hypothetical protein
MYEFYFLDTSIILIQNYDNYENQETIYTYHILKIILYYNFINITSRTFQKSNNNTNLIFSLL